jgi:hypothetical protein
MAHVLQEASRVLWDTLILDDEDTFLFKVYGSSFSRFVPHIVKTEGKLMTFVEELQYISIEGMENG